MSAIIIRRATVADADCMAAWRACSAFERSGGGAANRDAYARQCAQFFRAELGKEQSFLRSWIAVYDGVNAGGASLTVVPTLPRYGMTFNQYDGRIRDVFVEPEFRRKGIATALVRTIVEEARAIPVDRLALGAAEAARTLYERLGFVAKPDEMVYEG